MNGRKITLGMVQTACSNDHAANVEKTIAGIRNAASQGANVISTQELFRTPYFCQREDPALFDLAETIPGPTTQIIQDTAKDLGVVIVGSLFEKRAPGLHHNTAVVVDATGELLGVYRKMHIPHDPLYFEKYYFSPGDTGFRVWDTKFGKIAVLICWDQWYPEGARLAALAGAELLIYPTAIGLIDDDVEVLGEAEHDAWETIQRSHAISNGLFVAAINRVGREGPVTFFGQSFVADPFGRVLARASEDKDEVVVCDLDLGLIEQTRRNWPFLRDRRIDAYGPITQRMID